MCKIFQIIILGCYGETFLNFFEKLKFVVLCVMHFYLFLHEIGTLIAKKSSCFLGGWVQNKGYLKS